MMKQILLIELNFIFNAQTGWSVTNWLFITSCEGVGLKHIIRLFKVNAAVENKKDSSSF